MSIRIRFAGPDDASTLHRFIVELATYEREPHAVASTPETLRRQLEAERPPFESLLAEIDGEPVGFALFFQSYSTWLGQPGMYLEDLFVSPRYRRQGIGHALLASLARLSLERGYGRLEWPVLDWNLPAIEFYQSLAARPQDTWTVFRLTDQPLRRLAGHAPAGATPAPPVPARGGRTGGHGAQR